MSADLQATHGNKLVPRSNGCCVVIVGASGTGKDSLIGYARQQLETDERFVFMRRVITRAPDDDTENHLAVSPEKFSQMKRTGAFCVDWEAHGLSYGISNAAVDSVRAGRIVIFNGSRRALELLHDTFERMLVIEIVANPETVEARLNGRNRENAQEIAARMARDAAVDPRFAPMRIDNNGRLEDGGKTLVEAIVSAPRLARQRVADIV